MSYNYDNWERLVTAVLRREEFRYLAMLTDLASDSSTSNNGSSGSPSLRTCPSFFLDQSSIQGEIWNSSSRTREWIRRNSCQENDFVGLNEDTEKLVAQLVNENVTNCSHVVSIIGKGGLGKTALARRIYHHRDVRSHFRAFAWVIISREWQPEEVLQKIIYKLVPEKREQISRMGNILELINQLFEVLKAKNCLVVLDNVCGTDVWETVRHAFLARKSRSKILFTTRVKEIARRIDTDTTCYFYEQRHLNEEESWELLQRQVLFLINIAAGENEYASGSYLEDRSTFSSNSFRSCDTSLSDDGIEDEAADMKELGKEMVGLCAGLPLAIVQLGKILMTKSTLSEWKAVHQSFTSYLRERRNGYNGRVYETFTLSYHDLPYQTKQCFWYLGNFPKYYKFSVRKLYQLWAAEGFILSDSHPCEEKESITDVAERHLNILEQSGMVQVPQ